MPPYPKDDTADDVEEVEEIGLEAPEEAPEDSPASPKSTTSLALGKFHVDIDNRALPYVGIVGAATVLLIALVLPPVGLKNDGYGIAVCVVAMVFGLFGIYMTLKNTDLYDKELGSVPLLGNMTVGTGTAYFLFLWNFVGAGVLTFNAPFLVVSNGWVACWAGVLFALMALGVTTDTLKTKANDMGYLSALMLASIIQICAIIPELTRSHGSEAIYSLVVCIMTIILVMAFGKYEELEKYKFAAFAVFALLWLVLACLVTFRGPFIQVGNGWFSGWAGCIFSVMIMGSLMKGDDQ